MKILKTNVSSAMRTQPILSPLENQTLLSKQKLNCKCTFSHLNIINQICVADVQEAVLLTTCLTWCIYIYIYILVFLAILQLNDINKIWLNSHFCYETLSCSLPKVHLLKYVFMLSLEL